MRAWPRATPKAGSRQWGAGSLPLRPLFKIGAFAADLPQMQFPDAAQDPRRQAKKLPPIRVHAAATVRAVALTIFLAAFTNAYGAEEIDRLLAAVNGKVITEGDLLLARNLNAILSLGQNAAPSSRAEESDRLIDLEIMRQELGNFPMATEDQGKIQARMQELKNAYAEIGGLPGLLRSLGLQESELLEYLRLQDSIFRFIDFRFRSFASVSEQEIQQYYKETLVPPLQRAGSPIPPLAEVTGKIEAILREEKIDTSMNQWLQDIRHHSRIEYFLDGAQPPWGSKE